MFSFLLQWASADFTTPYTIGQWKFCWEFCLFLLLSMFHLFYRQLVDSKCGAAAVRCDDDAQSHAIEVSETIENLCLLRCIIFSSFHQWPIIDFIRKKTSFSVVEFDDSCWWRLQNRAHTNTPKKKKAISMMYIYCTRNILWNLLTTLRMMFSFQCNPPTMIWRRAIK